MALTYLEKVESEAPSTAGASVDGGRAVSTFLLEEPTADDLQNAINELLGGTTYASTGFKMQRTPPKAHPTFPFWYASNIPSIRGVGEFTLEDADPALEVPTIPQYALYEDYWFTVEFTPRPYPVGLDEDISVASGSWYDEGGTSRSFQYAKEWLRYTDYEYVPQFDNVSAQQGQMVFESTDAANKKGFLGSPRMFLPNQILKFWWFQVPYRYVTSANSYITKWVGRINQNAWYNWKPGQLLYLSYSPKRYSPPIPLEDDFWEGSFLTTQKLCNIEFTFLYTNRPATALAAAPTNRHYVQAGHNLLPWFQTRKFYYAKSVASTALGIPGDIPANLSFPIELLFTDPDAAGAYAPP